MFRRFLALISAAALVVACGGTSGDRETAARNLVEVLDVSEDEANCIIEAFGEDRLGSVDNFDPDFESDDAALAEEAAAAMLSCSDEIDEALAEELSDELTAPETPACEGACSYGDDPELDALYDACATGDGEACDDLFWESPADSEYEEFGASCGERGAASSCADAFSDEAAAASRDDGPDPGEESDQPEPVDCAEVQGPCDYGDDPRLDALWDECAEGNGRSCDELYRSSPINSRYEQYGDTCGDRGYEPTCEDIYGAGEA